MIRLLIASPIRLYCEGLARLLGPGFDVVGTAHGSTDWICATEELHPDVVLVDLALPERAAWFDALEDGAPTPRVVALFVPQEESVVVRCACAGVTAFVSRDATIDDLREAIPRASRGESVGPAWLMPMLLRRVAAAGNGDGDHGAGVGRLTRRERQVLDLIGEDLSNKEIAGRLNIELPTVKNHVHNILEKLDVHHRRDAAAHARQRVRV